MAEATDAHSRMNGHSEAASASDSAKASQETSSTCFPSQPSSEPDLDSVKDSHSMANGNGPNCSSIVVYEGSDRQTEVKGAFFLNQYVLRSGYGFCIA